MAKTKLPRETVAALEALADRVEREGSPPDHGVVWSHGFGDRDGPLPDLEDLVDGDVVGSLAELVGETYGDLFYVYWEPRGGMLTSCTTVSRVPLASGRTLAVQHYDVYTPWQVIGVIAADELYGEERVAQAVLAGESGGMWINGLPTSLRVACGGIVAVDALHHGLTRSSWAVSEVLGEDGEFCNADADLLDRGDERQQALASALEEHIDEEGDADGSAQRLLGAVVSTPVWLYALDDSDWQEILALRRHLPELPLYGQPPAWERHEPQEIGGDLWYLAAALLALYGNL